jgi:DNA polymerase III epsilon subunit-like protein
VVELGWIEVDEDFNFIAEVQSLIDPQRSIASAASAVHGLVLADLQDSPTIEEFFSVDDESCYGRPITEPVVLCGHNIAFDHRFVRPYITNVVQEVCSLRWARRLYPDADNHQLQTLVYELGLPRATAAHRVLSDVTTSLHLAKHICERTGLTLRQLAEASFEPMLMKTLSFGKHKGKSFAELPTPYLYWMVEKLAMDIDLKFSVEQQLKNRKRK